MTKAIKYLAVFYFLLISILTFPGVVAYTNYSAIGQKDFDTGVGFFNQGLTSWDTALRSLTEPEFLPLVGDLDGDGINEIVVIDSNNVRLYHGSALTIVDTFTLSDEGSSALLFDIDGDGHPEIITTLKDLGTIEILEYNGTDFYKEYNVSTGLAAYDKKLLACDPDSRRCMAVGAWTDIVAYGFNYSQVGPAFTNGGGGTVGEQLSNIPYMAVVDLLGDGNKEFIFTDNAISTGADKIYIYSYKFLNTAPNLTINQQDSKYIATADLWGGPFTSEGGVSPPLCANLDHSIGNALECAVAYPTAANSWKIAIFGSDLEVDSGDYFPSASTADGSILSNLVVGQFFDDDDTSVCAVGYEPSATAEYHVLCASQTTGHLIDNRIYDGNMVFGERRYYGIKSIDISPVIHSGQMESVLYNGKDFLEIISAAGVLRLDWDSCNVLGYCDLWNIWMLPQQNASVVPVDAEKVGRNDLIAMTKGNIYYWDDGYTNQGPNLSYYYVNPCITSIWKVNTSVEVRSKYEDPDGDQVRAMASLYCHQTGEINSSWSALGPSGTTFSFSFVANRTAPSAQICLYGQDVYNHSTSSVLTFSVGTSGVVLGDCTTAIIIALTGGGNVTNGTGALPSSVTSAQTHNVISNTFANLDSQYNWGFGTNAMWLIFIILCVVAVFVFGATNGIPAGVLISINLLIAGLLTILGAVLHVLSVGVIIVLTLFILAVVGIQIKNLIAG
jgi:hypothetical protein